MNSMKIVSLNTGLPREVQWHDRTVTTGIYKEPVDGRVSLRRLNLDGDRQADLSVHGGEFKAVYCYPIEHYAWWTKELGGRPLPAGMFGENFTTDGLDENSVHLGDQFSIGFLASGRTGFYLAVQQEGNVGAGDTIALVDRDPHRVRVADITRLYVAKTFSRDDVVTVRSALRVAALPESWKAHLRERLATV